MIIYLMMEKYILYTNKLVLELEDFLVLNLIYKIYLLEVMMDVILEKLLLRVMIQFYYQVIILKLSLEYLLI